MAYSSSRTAESRIQMSIDTPLNAARNDNDTAPTATATTTTRMPKSSSAGARNSNTRKQGSASSPTVP
jgi:hypothetical protein